MKVKMIENSNGEFEKNQINSIKTFLNLCKYDVIPSILVGSLSSAFLTHTYSREGMISAITFGSISGAALILAINGVITGVKTNKLQRDKIREAIDNKVNEKGKRI